MNRNSIYSLTFVQILKQARDEIREDFARKRSLKTK